MRCLVLIKAIAVISVVSGLVVASGQTDGPRTRSRGGSPVPRPSRHELSAAEQSAWIDENLPKLLTAMAAAPEVRAKIGSSLSLNEDRSTFPVMPQAAGLAPGDVQQLSKLIQAAVASNPRYRTGAKNTPQPTVTRMPKTGIFRVEIKYPAPVATRTLEPGPLTIDVWICPNRSTALGLFWIRRWGAKFLEPSPPSELAKSVAEAPDFGKAKSAEEGLGESSYWLSPGLVNALPLTKADAPIPADRLSFLRGNVVVETSTFEFALDEEQNLWQVTYLRHCGPDATSIMRAIDAGLIRLPGRGELDRRVKGISRRPGP